MTPKQAHDIREKKLRLALEKKLLTFDEILREYSFRTGFVGPWILANQLNPREVSNQSGFER